MLFGPLMALPGGPEPMVPDLLPQTQPPSLIQRVSSMRILKLLEGWLESA